MATSTELAKTVVAVADGLVTATTYDRIGADRLVMSLVYGSSAATRAGLPDDTALVNEGLKNHVVLEPQGE